MTAAAGQHASYRLLVDVFGTVGPQKHDCGAFDIASAEIRMARHVQAVAGEFDPIERQRSVGPDVAWKGDPLGVLERSAFSADTDRQRRMIYDFYTTDTHGLQITAVITPWLDAPGLEIPLDITSREAQALREDSSPLQLVRRQKCQPIFQFCVGDRATAASGLARDQPERQD